MSSPFTGILSLRKELNVSFLCYNRIVSKVFRNINKNRNALKESIVRYDYDILDSEGRTVRSKSVDNRSQIKNKIDNYFFILMSFVHFLQIKNNKICDKIFNIFCPICTCNKSTFRYFVA
ncbi:hypothetical protein MHBO_001654 [Bonamia ostreae]|uniref:Uncharacterized protein n=1 Tax=Bonamia ostreae TaxID=126728 RepID=A0ABV2AJR9_9EUKA